MIPVKDAVYLYPLSIEDVLIIYKTIDRERDYLREWLPFVDETTHIDFTRAYVQNVLDTNQIQYSIYEGKTFMGLIGFSHMDKADKKAEIGYWISERQQGRGIVTHSVKKLLEIAFSELELNSVRIKVAVGNEKSQKIPERLNFKQEGIEREGLLLATKEFTDLAVYSMLKREYVNDLE